MLTSLLALEIERARRGAAASNDERRLLGELATLMDRIRAPRPAHERAELTRRMSALEAELAACLARSGRAVLAEALWPRPDGEVWS